MTKKAEKNESNEIQELREKHTAAIGHYEKSNATLVKVTEKTDTLEQDMARLLSQVKNAENEYRAAEKQHLRDEITKTDLDKIAKKQDDSVKAMHKAERALTVARQVIDDLNHEIRTAVNKRDVARQRLCTAIRAELIGQIPADLADQLLKICGSYPEPVWRQVLFDTFPEPHPEKIKAAQAEFNKWLK